MLVLVTKIGGEMFGDSVVQIGEGGVFRRVIDGVPFVLDFHAHARREGDSMCQLPCSAEGVVVGHASTASRSRVFPFDVGNVGEEEIGNGEVTEGQAGDWFPIAVAVGAF